MRPTQGRRTLGRPPVGLSVPWLMRTRARWPAGARPGGRGDSGLAVQETLTPNGAAGTFFTVSGTGNPEPVTFK